MKIKMSQRKKFKSPKYMERLIIKDKSIKTILNSEKISQVNRRQARTHLPTKAI